MKTLLLSTMAVIALSTTDIVAQDNFCNTIEARSLMVEDINRAMRSHSLEVIDLYDFKTVKMDRDKFEIVCEGTVEWSNSEVEKIRFSTSKNSMGTPIFKIQPIQ